MSSDLLNTARMAKMAKAAKPEWNVHRITFNPSSANPGETLYVMLPKLGNDMVFLPFSTFLRFGLEITKGQANNTFVQNASRNLVRQMKVILGSKTIKDTDRFDHFEGYYEMLTIEEDMMMGIQEADYRKLRSDAGDKPTDAVKVMRCDAYGSKFSIPLTHPILDKHGGFYQKALKDDLKFEIKLAGADMIAITSDSSKDYNYTLKNIQLEYTTSLPPELSSSNKTDCLKTKIPFHCLITGPTNCGKTKYVVDLLRGPFNNVSHVIILIYPTFAMNKTWAGFAHGDPRFWVIAPDSSQPDEVEESLRICTNLFHDKDRYDVLLILNDCAVSSDVKKRSSKLIDLAFSGRHKKISVWVLTEQLTSIAKPFQENLGCVIAFHNPEEDSSDLFSTKLGSGISAEEKKNILKILKDNEYSRICVPIRHPYSYHVEIPH